MGQKLTWEEIRTQFPDKFVLIDNCDEHQIDATHSEILGGEVVLVTSDGKRVFDEYKRRGKPSAMTFAHTHWLKLEIEDIQAPSLRLMHNHE
ncbi:MAG: hypothetical protein V2A66_01230 [Pseudomonadota bacterium]